MLPQNVIDALIFICRVGHKIGALPIVWHPGENSIRWTRNRRRKVLFVFIALYTFWNFCFMSVRWAQAFCCMRHLSFVTPGKLLMNLFNVATHLCGSILFLNTILKSQRIQSLVFHLMRVNDNFRLNLCPRKYVEPKSDRGSLIKRCILPPYVYSLMQFFISIATVDKNPKYLYFLLNLKGVAKWKLLPIGVFEAYMSLNICTIMLFYLFIYMAYARSTAPCLRLLLARPRYTRTLLHYYRQLQIVNRMFHHLMKTLIMPMMPAVLLLFVVTSGYSSIKLYHEVKMPGYLGFPFATAASVFCLCEIFPPAYRMYGLSKGLLRANLLRSRRRHYNYKVVKSMVPLAVHIGQFYKVKRATILTVAFIGIDATINMLITF